MLDFNSTLNDFGYTPENHDFESTIIGFSYDIDFALFNSDSIFHLDQCQINRNWNTPSAYIHAQLVAVDGNLERATRYLIECWYRELRYDNPVYEVVSAQSSGIQSVLRVLTVTKLNAMTLMFTVRKGMYEPI